jgi:hypothetical protein
MAEFAFVIIGAVLAVAGGEVARRGWAAAPTIRGWIRLSEIRAACAGCFFFFAAIAVGLSYTGHHHTATYVTWYILAATALAGVLVATALVGRSRSGSGPQASAASTSPPQEPELTSLAHRDEIREILNRCAGVIQVHFAYTWGDELRRSIVAAHYPDIVRQIDDWNETARRPRAARQALRDRLSNELELLALEDNFAVKVIVEGFAVYTEHRADKGQLADQIERAQLWEVFRPERGPADGAHVRGFRDIAILVDNSIQDPPYTDIAIGMIDRVMPVFNAAQQWPEASAITDAQRAMDAYDKAPVLDEIRRITMRERIAAVAGCPVCGEIG